MPSVTELFRTVEEAIGDTPPTETLDRLRSDLETLPSELNSGRSRWMLDRETVLETVRRIRDELA